MRVYKFSTSATETAPDITAGHLIKQMKDGSRYTFGNDDLLRDGVFKLNGWAFDLREELNQYLVKQYGSWQEYYAPNKTSLRALVYGRIDTIREL